jgi:hypothetical protein
VAYLRLPLSDDLGRCPDGWCLWDVNAGAAGHARDYSAVAAAQIRPVNLLSLPTLVQNQQMIKLQLRPLADHKAEALLDAEALYSTAATGL